MSTENNLTLEQSFEKTLPLYKATRDDGTSFLWCYARQLYSLLNVKSHYKDWIKRQIEICKLTQSIDFTALIFEQHSKGAKVYVTEHQLTRKAALKILLKSRSSFAEPIENYLLDAEEILFNAKQADRLNEIDLLKFNQAQLNLQQQLVQNLQMQLAQQQQIAYATLQAYGETAAELVSTQKKLQVTTERLNFEKESLNNFTRSACILTDIVTELREENAKLENQLTQRKATSLRKIAPSATEEDLTQQQINELWEIVDYDRRTRH